MISQTSEYALRAVVTLGSQGGRPMTTRQIAARTQVPACYLAKVLQGLGRAGLVEAQRGLRGGFVLTQSLDRLTILDVINAVDPLVRIGRCPLGLREHRDRLCPLHQRLDEGLALIETFYGKMTIADLLDDRGAEHPLCAASPAGPEAAD